MTGRSPKSNEQIDNARSAIWSLLYANPLERWERRHWKPLVLLILALGALGLYIARQQDQVGTTIDVSTWKVGGAPVPTTQGVLLPLLSHGEDQGYWGLCPPNAPHHPPKVGVLLGHQNAGELPAAIEEALGQRPNHRAVVWLLDSCWDQ